jgi:RNA polymerase sigma-70 factor (family 1)
MIIRICQADCRISRVWHCYPNRKFLSSVLMGSQNRKTERSTLNPSDAELVKAIRESNAEAFKTLYFRYYDPLFRYVWYRTRSSEFVRDVMQDLFTRVWQNRRTLDPGQSIKAYLYRIAHNLLIDDIRREALRKDHLIETTIQNDAIPDDDPELRMDIQKAVEELPGTLREAFMLNRYQGLKYSEIAEVCGVSIKTVESRISQALEILRKKLSDQL